MAFLLIRIFESKSVCDPFIFPSLSSQYVACYLHLHIHPAAHAHILTHTRLHLNPKLLTSGQYHPQSVCYHVVVNYPKERRKDKAHCESTSWLLHIYQSERLPDINMHK